MSAISSMPEPWKRRLFLPAYTVRDTARYAGIHPTTVSYWHYQGGRYGPALPGKERGQSLSYLELMEVAVVATFRRLGVKLRQIRTTRDYCAQVLQSAYPFAEYKFKAEGQRMLLDLQQVEPDPGIEALIITTSAGQMTWKEEVTSRFLEFDYEQDLAIKWHVVGREAPIVIDPRVCFGAPTVQGIPTWALRGRAIAGETAAELAADFRIDEALVVRALSFEGIAA